MQPFRSAWNDFDTRIGRIVKNLHYRKNLVESQANQLQIMDVQRERAAAEAQFDETARQKKKDKSIAIASWLNGAKSHMDIEDAKDVRKAYPESGCWLLNHPSTKAWLDFGSEEKPPVWFRGISGAVGYRLWLSLHHPL
jgi:hypothetical protein